MESVKTPVTRYTTYTKVREIHEHKVLRWVGGVGANAEFKEISQGYFMFLEGSFESIHVGFTPPELKPGDRVKVTFERID